MQDGIPRLGNDLIFNPITCAHKLNTEIRPPLFQRISYGYGWVLVGAGEKSMMGDLGITKPYIIHGGKTDGYKAMLININGGEYVISFLSNVGGRTQEMELAQKIVNILIK